MENMKRVISAVMALVLVLGMMPGVPVFAGAEEVETQPETVAVETTEAVTVPETTVPEESIPETTVAEESIPETTVAEETIPEETVAQESVPEETIPEETVSEEVVPEETASEEASEDLTANEEAADAVVLHPVSNIIVSVSTTYTYVGDEVKLTAKVSPENADYPAVEFYVVEATADYDVDILQNKGYLIAKSAGTVTVAARAMDKGDESYDSGDPELGDKASKVTITFVDYSMEINELAIEKEDWYNGMLRVMTGKKLDLSAHYLVNGEVSVHLPTLKPDITWYLGSGESEYATVEVNPDNCREVKVTAKPVTESKIITLYAKEKNIGIVDSIQIAVYPIPYKVGIYENGVERTGETITIPLTAAEIADLQEQGVEYLERQLTAQVWPLEAEEPMVWTTSDNLVRITHPDKESAEQEELAPAAEEEPEKDTTQANLKVDFRRGETTITVASKNYPEIKSTVKIVRKWVLAEDEIDFDVETQMLQDKGEGLVSGQSFQMKVYDARDPYAPTLLDGNTVKWSLSEEDQAFATISKDGMLTAVKDLKVGAEVTVRCAIIGDEDSYKELIIPIRPLATEVRILPGALASAAFPADMVVNGATLPVNTNGGCDPFRMEVQVHPYAEGEVNALQKVTWKSSNTAIATYNTVTDKIEWKGKNGTVTFTVTAADGSGKKATVNLKFCAMATGLDILENRDELFLRSGQSWTMEVEFAGNPSDKSVTWSLLGENDKQYATLSTKGKLTAKTVYEEHIVTVCASANDGSGVFDVLEVLIKPKKDGILILKTGDKYVTKTNQIIPVYDDIDLDAYILNMEDEEEDVIWKSSSSKTASVDENGVVTVHKAGKVTITATSVYDSKNKATVTIQGVSMVDEIRWTHTHEQEGLACGKSMTLKAKAYDAQGKTPTISKLAWSIAGNGGKYAKVSNGKVTAYANALAYDKAPVDITVLAKATDGSGVVAEWDITIYPIVQKVTIENPAEVAVNTPSKGINTFVMENPGQDTVQLNAQVWPANAYDVVTWKSSNAKIASIDADGEVTVHKSGTVTFTATAADGSGKKATYKMTVLAIPETIAFDMAHLAIAGGKSLKIKPVLLDGNGNKVSGKKLEWKVSAIDGMDDGTAYVTSISGGTLKTKKVTEPKWVMVTVRTVEKKDEWEIEVSLPIGIYPAVNSLKILNNAGEDIGLTRWDSLSAGSLQLKTSITAKAGQTPYNGVTWKSSNTKIATVNANGLVTFLKAGTVTIYAYAADGTSVKDSVKITIRK